MGRNNDYGYDSGGLAFFLAPLELEQPQDAYDGGLGLFNLTTFTGPLYQMVAMEFDTFKNLWDPDNNNVGIDVNDVYSNFSVSLSYSSLFNCSCDQHLTNGDTWDAWVDYDGGEKSLQVFLLYNSTNANFSKPKNPLFSYPIDLRSFLPENIKVGLSAATEYSTAMLP
ncbi:bark lectin-like [Cryptomeria japonica]|uniref:bark lectin-like n=1 Tax=Cryptomeria japonica TaxID=3369 RepID=UPI0027DA6C82|nr:bark lectin-like [Cryptomeria japonica]